MIDDLSIDWNHLSYRVIASSTTHWFNDVIQWFIDDAMTQ